jgi:hypothetical protein
MRCPRCWTEKAYLSSVSGWRGILLAIVLRVPMRCHHCYHRFSVWWFATLGQQIEPPQKRVVPVIRAAVPSCTVQPRRNLDVSTSVCSTTDRSVATN